MAVLVEVIVEGGVDGAELLECLHPAEAKHRSLSSSERQVGVFHPVVGPTADLLTITVSKVVERGCV